jgi:Protein of unknown function (DUF2442)
VTRRCTGAADPTLRWCASIRFRSSGELDASDRGWNGVFEPLRDPVYFARVELDEELGTINWPNGADVAPETLHLWIASGRQNVSA